MERLSSGKIIAQISQRPFVRDESVCLSSLESRETLYVTCRRARKYQKTIPRIIILLAGGYAGYTLHHILNLFPWCSQCVNRVSWCLVLTKMFHAETKSYLVFSLSNDPGKKGSDFFCYGAIRCPHIAKFSFLHREYVNLQKRRTTK